MKRKNLILLIVICAVVIEICAVIFVVSLVFMVRKLQESHLFEMLFDHQEYYELEAVSESPDRSYTLEAYRVSTGGATVDFSQRVYLVEGTEKKLIYDVYGEHSMEIKWINDSVVSLNGKTLDLAKGQTYDWKWKRSITYSLFVEPFELFRNLLENGN